jgi:hypothetical protein
VETDVAEEPEVLTTTEARSGTGTHVVRYILIVSVILAVAAMVWTFVLAPQASQQGATSTGPQDGATVTR